jgi:hypothetical protein
MQISLRRIFVASLFVSNLAFAQPVLRFKTRQISPVAGKVDSREAAVERRAAAYDRGHFVVQFDEAPSAEVVAALAARGVRVLQDVPDNALLVSLSGPVSFDELGARYAAPLDPADKVSPLITPLELTRDLSVLVEFHPDVDLNDARRLLLNQGIEIQENPDLGPHRLMVRLNGRLQDVRVLRSLARADEVAYIFPASRELASGTPVAACAGAVTNNGTAGQYITTYGDGWDGPGRNAATLRYLFSQMTAQLPAGTAQSEIQRAMAEWASVIKLTWEPGVSATAVRTVNILFGRGSHGDAYPFDGPGRVLAHTFYPAPPNPEPIAGDLHFDEDEAWRVGVNMDLYSVALHELGHALGLGHSDNPNAVMYPYYKMVSALAADDKAAILSIYAPQDGSATPPPAPTPAPTPSAPLSLVINVPPATTTAPTISLSGSVSGGSGTITLTWSTGSASGFATLAGTNWTAAVPLAPGANTITLIARDSATQVARSFTVQREAAATPPPSTDTTAPALAISSPGGTSVWTTQSMLTFRGTASDNVAVRSVTWTTNTGASGTASGTTQWSAVVPLLVGSNAVTIRATDTSGNVAWRTVVVTRR